MLDVESLGQVFTPRHIVDTMLRLAKNAKRLENPRFLEPSCGDGAFLRHLPSNAVGVEIDTNLCADSALESKIVHIDFFALSLDEKFDCIIGNPPYVRYQDIVDSTKDVSNTHL
ncbi:MAG: Eco57I restriction-modification methylase domain-containing protein, partial [Helicobacter sp.]|nr:Eco57I restriction-modification methylase domain-containing protein [Helicobacter sp.]